MGNWFAGLFSEKRNPNAGYRMPQGTLAPKIKSDGHIGAIARTVAAQALDRADEHGGWNCDVAGHRWEPVQGTKSDLRCVECPATWSKP